MADISQINIPNGDSSVTHNLKDASVPHSSLPAVSGGTDLSLVTTGEKADWIDKTKIYQVECTLGSSRGMWNCNLDLPVLYDGLLLLCKCPSDTYNNGGTISLYVTLSDGTVVDNIVIGGNLSNVSLGEYYLFRYSVSDIVTTWDWVGALAYGGRYVSQQPRNTGFISLSYPLLFSDTSADSTSGYMYTATAYTYRLSYDPYNANLVTPKINNYTLAPACEKQVDTEVEQSSDNLPTSDAVYNAVNAIHIQTKTASGVIVTFNDAAGGVPFAALKSEINPVQDLHGYSKPWSGGGGKNKFNDTTGTHTINANTDTTITIGDVYLEANTTYTISCKQTPAPLTSFVRNTLSVVGNGTTTYNPAGNDYTIKPMVFTPTVSGTYSIRVWGHTLSANTTYSEFQVEVGSTATAYEPYSNICPISGFSALNVTRTGVNLWDEEWELGGISPDGNNLPNTDRIRSKNFIPVKPNLSVFINYLDSRTINFYICEYDINKTFIQRTIRSKNTVFTTSYNCYFIRFFVYSSVNPVTTYGNDISINYPSSDTEYHAYNGQTATVNFGQTVYGGVADVTNGKVTITHGIITDWSNVSFTYSSSYGFLFTLSGLKTGVSDITNILKCSHYENAGMAGFGYVTEGKIGTNSSGGANTDRICIKDSNYSDVSAFKSFLINSNAQLVYELATLIEIDTTAENLTAIVGQNNVYSDTNGDTEVEYFSGDCDGIIKLLKALMVI